MCGIGIRLKDGYATIELNDIEKREGEITVKRKIKK